MAEIKTKPFYRHGILKCNICDRIISQCGCPDTTIHYSVCEKCKTKSGKLIEKTQECINKYPGTIEQLRNDWQGIIEDILFLFDLDRKGKL